MACGRQVAVGTHVTSSLESNLEFIKQHIRLIQECNTDARLLMVADVNTREYWNRRFSSGDWEAKRGRWQTKSFAEKQVTLLGLSSRFDGSLLDFGCGLGDALPVYRKHFPLANLFGIDHSEEAIIRCRKKYGDVATFYHGDHDSVPPVDVIIASNVLEHINNDRFVATVLQSKCSWLYIFVPYMESPLCEEHVNYYREGYYSLLPVYETKIFYTLGWSQYGRALWVDVYLKNLLRPFLNKPIINRNKQIMFRIIGGYTRSREA